MMASYEIRIFGDPVLRQVADEITEVDDRLVKLADDMLDTLYEVPGGGLGLAATQVGVRKRMFVYDLGEGPGVLVNPRIDGSDGEWVYAEGCLSIPGLSWEILRPKQVHVRGHDLDGNEVSFEADELMARLVQHELDHLNGRLVIDLMEKDQRKEAMKAIREHVLEPLSQRV